LTVDFDRIFAEIDSRCDIDRIFQVGESSSTVDIDRIFKWVNPYQPSISTMTNRPVD